MKLQFELSFRCCCCRSLSSNCVKGVQIRSFFLVRIWTLFTLCHSLINWYLDIWHDRLLRFCSYCIYVWLRQKHLQFSESFKCSFVCLFVFCFFCVLHSFVIKPPDSSILFGSFQLFCPYSLVTNRMGVWKNHQHLISRGME